MLSEQSCEAYDLFCAPIFVAPFAPYLADVFKAQRCRLVETACGTGVCTSELSQILAPGSSIEATDINQHMIARARKHISVPSVSFRSADATDLPFDDEQFEAAACHFGVMFFPNPELAFVEMRRVLQKGARFAFTTWDRIEANPLHAAGDRVREAVSPIIGLPVPQSVLCSYYDETLIHRDLLSARFEIERFERYSMSIAINDTTHLSELILRGSLINSDLTGSFSNREVLNTAVGILDNFFMREALPDFGTAIRVSTIAV